MNDNNAARMALGRMIKGIMKAKGVSQKRIALEAKTSESTVSRWLEPKSPMLPDAEQLAAICRALEIDPSGLLAPFGVEWSPDPTLMRVWAGVLALSDDQRERLAFFLEGLKTGGA